MPRTYRYYRPVWPGWAVFVVLAGAIGGFWGWRGERLVIIYLFCAIAAIIVGVAVFAWWFDWAWECVVEGEMLCFRSMLHARRQISIAEIEEIVALQGSSSGGNEGYSCELALTGNRRIWVDCGPLAMLAQPGFGFQKEHKRFRAAILGVNPNIRFTKRNALDCHACGARMKPLQFTESRCSNCGAIKAVRLNSALPDHQ